MKFRTLKILLLLCHWNSDSVCIESLDHLGHCGYFNNIMSSKSHVWDSSSLICALSVATSCFWSSHKDNLVHFLSGCLCGGKRAWGFLSCYISDVTSAHQVSVHYVGLAPAPQIILMQEICGICIWKCCPIPVVLKNGRSASIPADALMY